MKRSQTLSYTTSDKQVFATRKDAVAHQTNLDRAARVLALLNGDDALSSDFINAHDHDDYAKAIARVGDALIAALTLPSGRAPRAPKAPVAPAVAE